MTFLMLISWHFYFLLSNPLFLIMNYSSQCTTHRVSSTKSITEERQLSGRKSEDAKGKHLDVWAQYMKIIVVFNMVVC